VTLRECEPQGRFGEELREVVELWPGTGIGASLNWWDWNQSIPSHFISVLMGKKLDPRGNDRC
jgi:hypothetical protein